MATQNTRFRFRVNDLVTLKGLKGLWDVLYWDVVEDRGDIGPNGCQILRISSRSHDHTLQIEMRADQLEMWCNGDEIRKLSVTQGVST